MRVLLIEDSEDLSSLLVRGLATAGFAVDCVTTAANADAALATTRFAAVILDLGLPDGDGLGVLGSLRRRDDPTPVIVLTARSAVPDRVKALQSGADDYLTKPFALEELIARLRALLRRPGLLLGLTLEVANLSLDTEARQVCVDAATVPLSQREIAVLEMLMRRTGRVVSKKNIESQLYGLYKDIGSNTIEVYMHRIRKQLIETGARVEIHTIRGVGYLIKAVES
jgi:two-component system response regulator TctD